MTDEDKTRLPGEASNGSNLLTPGQSFGQYRVIRLLGRGGMGEVYEMENPVIGQRFALKLVNREILERPKALERFQQEARVMSGFNHPNIVKVDDYGETQGQRWLRMPLMGNFIDEKGRSLQSLEDCVKGGRVLPEGRVLDYLRQILSGLGYAHSQDAVHRDIKPSNILFDAQGQLKITDFGLVHMAGEDWMQSRVQLSVAQSMTQASDPHSASSGQADATRLDGSTGSEAAGTSTQALLGTFEYMAPEQKRGEPADARSDLYAVGLMAFRMLTGESVPGFKGPSRINPDLSTDWDEWVERAMESRPESRFNSAEEMAQALPDGKPSMADGGSVMADRQKSKKGLWLGLAALLVVGAVLGLGYVMRDTGSGMRHTGSSASAELTAESAESANVRQKAVAGAPEANVAEAVSPKEIEPGGVIIKTEPAGATVRVGDSPAQRSPAVFERLDPGAQSVHVELAGYDPLSVNVEVLSGEYAQPPVYPLRRSMGSLMVRSNPPGAKILLDGKELGTAPLSESNLLVGEYRLRAEWPRFFEAVDKSVEIVRGENNEVQIESTGLDFKVSLGSATAIELKWIEAGSFTMGSPPDEAGRDSDERAHEVTLSEGFWLGATEVTHGQWKELMGTDLRAQVKKALKDDTLYNLGGKMQTLRDFWGVSEDVDPTSRFGADGDDIPMHYVSWEEAMEFCRKLTERERKAGRLPPGYAYSLPSEAQWEYACRAGTATATYAGPMEILGKHNAPVLDAIAWYGGNSSEGYTGRGWNTDSWEEKQYPGGTAGPRDVGTRQPNAWGLHDMLGNVWEWCGDWYGSYPSGSVVDPSGANSGSFRVFRGGGWNYFARNCRSANRSGITPGYRFNYLGFRLALSVNH